MLKVRLSGSNMKLEELRKELRRAPEYIEAEKELKPFLVLANNILRFRMAKGWSQSELARRAETKQLYPEQRHVEHPAAGGNRLVGFNKMESHRVDKFGR